MNADNDAHTDSEIRKFYELKNIAVEGMSKSEEKPARSEDVPSVVDGVIKNK
jgi:hypothetical protein